MGFSLSPQLDWLWSLVVVGGRRGVGLARFALASALAFLVSESIDWLIYSLTHRPFADRVLISVAFSAPVDTACFLFLGNIWSWPLFAISLGAKLLSGDALSQMLRYRIT